MKRLWKIIALLSALSFLTGCIWFEGVSFSEVEIGKNFIHSRDGHCKKLPQNYCLYVDLGSVTQLLKVAEEKIDEVWDPSSEYNKHILERHFIKGYFNDEYLLLCEEKEDDSLVYWSLKFSDETIESYTDIEQVYKLFPASSIHWFVLCNTNAEIRSINK